MFQKKSFNFGAVLIPVLFTLVQQRRCDTQVSSGETNWSSDGHEGDTSAFFALRGCHQLLQSDSGEFFSPDYLCSNPPLWCNWTIQVDPAQRIHLYLEDLSPEDSCHLKQDQIYIDEPVGHLLGQKVLEKCWREAKFTSSSNILHVVLLIGGWPSPPYRGFYSRYQTFGPLVLYDPRDGFTERSSSSSPAELDFSEFDPHLSGFGKTLLHCGRSVQHVAEDAQMPWEVEGVLETHSEVGENISPILDVYNYVVPTVPASPQRTPRSGRVTRAIEQDRVLVTNSSRTLSWLDGKFINESEPSADGETGTDIAPASNRAPSPLDWVGGKGTHPSHPHSNGVEPLMDHGGSSNLENHSAAAQLPGDHLFEVSLEVNFAEGLEESWEDVAAILLHSIKALISQRMDSLQTSQSASTKRIKRLHSGVLYILWLHVRRGPGGALVHRVLHTALQSLLSDDAVLDGKATVLSVSTADVNECGTHLVLCDVNADCVNQFGSYSCHCRSGFRDHSRLGSGGTLCAEVKRAGCSSALSSETKSVYVLFFLLSTLLLMLFVGAGVLYRRHHQGAFLVRCRSSSSSSISPPDSNNNYRPSDSYSNPGDRDLPPPPPPTRGHRDAWVQAKDRRPAVDLPLLRFSPLLPPDGYVDPQEGGKL